MLKDSPQPTFGSKPAPVSGTMQHVTLVRGLTEISRSKRVRPFVGESPRDRDHARGTDDPRDREPRSD